MGAYNFELLQVARMYYLENMTQQQIAQELNISRSTVSRWLTKSREEGLVRINLAYPYASNDKLAEELRSKYGLRESLVVMRRGEDEEGLSALLGSCAAFFLQTMVFPGCILGLSWGRALKEMVNALASREALNVKVVQLSGGLPDAAHQLQANALVQKVSSRLGGQPYYLHAPAVVADEELASGLLADNTIRNALDLGTQADLAVVGIGACNREASLTRMGLFSPEEMAAIEGKGAVGEICARFFDSSGIPILNPFDSRTISLSLAQLQGIPNLVGVAGGQNKVPAIRAALVGGYINTLITDEDTARCLLDS